MIGNVFQYIEKIPYQLIVVLSNINKASYNGQPRTKYSFRCRNVAFSGRFSRPGLRQMDHWSGKEYKAVRAASTGSPNRFTIQLSITSDATIFTTSTSPIRHVVFRKILHKLVLQLGRRLKTIGYSKVGGGGLWVMGYEEEVNKYHGDFADVCSKPCITITLSI